MKRLGAVLAAVTALVALTGCEPKATVTGRSDTVPAQCQQGFNIVGSVYPYNATPRVVLQQDINGKWADATARIPDATPHVAASPVDQTTGIYKPILWFEYTGKTLHFRVRSDSGQNVSPPFTVTVQPC